MRLSLLARWLPFRLLTLDCSIRKRNAEIPRKKTISIQNRLDQNITFFLHWYPVLQSIFPVSYFQAFKRRVSTEHLSKQIAIIMRIAAATAHPIILSSSSFFTALSPLTLIIEPFQLLPLNLKISFIIDGSLRFFSFKGSWLFLPKKKTAACVSV